MSSRSWGSRVVGGLLGGTVGAELLYLLVANGFLAQSGDKLTSEAFSVTWSSARTWFPGQLQLTGPQVVLRQGPVHVSARAESARVGLHLLDLFQSTITVQRLEVEGLELAVGREQVTPARSSAEGPSGWMIDLQGVEVGIDRLAFGEVVIGDGSGRLSGRGRVVFGGEAQVSDLRLSWSGATLARGGVPLVAPLAFGFRGGLTEVPRKDATEALAGLDGTIRLFGQARSLGPLRSLMTSASWLEALDGAGEVQADLSLADGLLAPGGTFRVAATDLTLGALGVVAAGSGAVEGEVLDEAIRFELTFAEVEVKREGDLLLTGRGSSLVAEAAGRGLLPGHRDLTVDLALPDLALPDVSVLARLLPTTEALQLTGGAGRLYVDARLSTVDQRCEGELGLDVVDLAGRYVDRSFVGQLEAKAKLTGADLAARRLQLGQVEASLTQVVFANADERYDWSAGLDAERGVLILSAPVGLDVQARLKMKNLRPVFDFFGQDHPLVKDLGRFFQVEDLEARARLALVEEGLFVHDFTLSSDPLLAAAELRLGKGPTFKGLMWARVGLFGVALERTGSQPALSVALARTWYDRRLPTFLAEYPFEGL